MFIKNEYQMCRLQASNFVTVYISTKWTATESNKHILVQMNLNNIMTRARDLGKRNTVAGNNERMYIFYYVKGLSCVVFVFIN